MKFTPTEEGVSFLCNYVPGHHRAEIISAFAEKFGIQLTIGQLRAFMRNHNLSTGFNGRFVKGRPSPCKGKKRSEYMSPEAIARARVNEFKKGHETFNKRPIGSERTDCDGYIKVKVAEPNVWKFKHRVVYEQTYGKIPQNHIIIFKDNNKQNFSPENLLCISKSQHAVLNRNGLNQYTGDLKDTALLIAEVKIQISNLKNRKK